MYRTLDEKVNHNRRFNPNFAYYPNTKDEQIKRIWKFFKSSILQQMH